MDPLGVLSDVVNASLLPKWSELPPISCPCHCSDASQSSTISRPSPFPVNRELNQKVVLWSGNVTKLNTVAIVNSTNESLSSRGSLSERIHLAAGPELLVECKQLHGCRTGEAKLSKGYNLPARYVVHTVGPRYNTKYRTAAESALFSCYRSVMRVLRENQLTSVGLSVINTVKRGYPPEDGAHIALRTVRRFLEHYGPCMELVVFVVEDADVSIYSKLMPMYFPRSESEELHAAASLPLDVGNAEGEPIIAERQIRIKDHLVVERDSGTVRRFLEHYGPCMELVVFVVEDADVSIYSKLMPMYFPRSESEELHAAASLPLDVGNAEGEPIIAERQIRIKDHLVVERDSGTVRRFLEHYGPCMELVVFVVEDADVSIYSKLMPMYFPRSESEELHAAASLPLDVGNAEGEPIIAERQIRIKDHLVVERDSGPVAIRQEYRLFFAVERCRQGYKCVVLEAVLEIYFQLKLRGTNSQTKFITILINDGSNLVMRENRRLSNSSWLKFDIKSAEERWIADPMRNQGITITCRICPGNIKVALGLWKWRNRNFPFPNPILRLRLTSKRHRTHETTARFCTKNNTHCCRRHFYLDFDCLGWFWIVSPKRLQVNICSGDCNITVHSLKMSHSRLLQRVSKIKSCCYPTQYSPHSITYFSDDGKLLTKTFQDISVDKCACPL